MELESWLQALTSGDDARAEMAALQTRALGEAALDALRCLLASPERDQRWWAARALAELPLAAAGNWLAGALSDDDPAVRQAAALALEKNPQPAAVPALVMALQDRDSLLARLAANALVATGRAASPALIAALPGLPDAARLEALRALALIADPAAIPALYAACDGDSSLAAYWAAEGLQRMGVGMVYFNP